MHNSFTLRKIPLMNNNFSITFEKLKPMKAKVITPWYEEIVVLIKCSGKFHVCKVFQIFHICTLQIIMMQGLDL